MEALVHPMFSALACRFLAARIPGFEPPVDLEAVTGVPVDVHRRLLSRVAEVGGEVVLVELARPLVTARGETLLYVLLNSGSVGDLLDKEMRLNRFFHSDHRVRDVEATERRLALTHHAIKGPPPSRVESLFVFGLHVTMLEAVGCQGLAARLPESASPDLCVVENGRVSVSNVPGGNVARWEFAWDAFEATRDPLAGLDEHLLASGPRDLTGAESASDAVRTVLQRDLSRSWTLPLVARHLHSAPRTLQRRLRAEGRTFTRLLEETRVDAAARMLRHTPSRSLTEIGYVCGFADAAHFSRSFKRCKGRTPSAWRTDGG